MKIIIPRCKGEYTYTEELWRAQDKLRYHLKVELDSYLSRLLKQYESCHDLLEKSTAILLLEGNYRECGDRCLLLSVLHAKLKEDYKVIGRTAYYNLNDEPFLSIANSFTKLGTVLEEVLKPKGD